MNSFIIWSKVNCPQCTQAKTLLASRGFDFEERCIGINWTREQLLEQVPDARSVPQVFYNNKHIGGFDQLRQLVEVLTEEYRHAS